MPAGAALRLRALPLGGGDVEDVVRFALLETLGARRASRSCRGRGWGGVERCSFSLKYSSSASRSALSFRSCAILSKIISKTCRGISACARRCSTDWMYCSNFAGYENALFRQERVSYEELRAVAMLDAEFEVHAHKVAMIALFLAVWRSRFGDNERHSRASRVWDVRLVRSSRFWALLDDVRVALHPRVSIGTVCPSVPRRWLPTPAYSLCSRRLRSYRATRQTMTIYSGSTRPWT
jgi:hypothetical protein